ncbi:MAG: hypothetical protein QXK89_08060 [Candidatus Bathyarchaeia archaeon]
MKAKLAKILIAIVITLLSFSFFPSIQSAYLDNYYKVEFIKVESYGTYQIWYYNITCLSNAPYGISFVAFGELDVECNPPCASIIESSCGGQDASVTVGIDPHTNKTVVKFDFSPSIEKGETRQVWIAISGIWPTGTIDVWVKAGTDLYGPASVTGPDCPEQVIPEAPFGTILLTAILFAALALYMMRKHQLPLLHNRIFNR